MVRRAHYGKEVGYVILLATNVFDNEVWEIHRVRIIDNGELRWTIMR